MPKLYLMVGLPCSGKTTYCEKYLSDCEIVSTDDIRAELWGNASDHHNNAEVFNIAFHQVAEKLTRGFDVAFDATNLRAKNRKTLTALVPADTQVTIVFLSTPVTECLRRNNQRTHHISEDIIVRMSQQIQYPTLDEAMTIFVTNGKGPKPKHNTLSA